MSFLFFGVLIMNFFYSTDLSPASLISKMIRRPRETFPFSQREAGQRQLTGGCVVAVCQEAKSFPQLKLCLFRG